MPNNKPITDEQVVKIKKHWTKHWKEYEKVPEYKMFELISPMVNSFLSSGEDDGTGYYPDYIADDDVLPMKKYLAKRIFKLISKAKNQALKEVLELVEDEELKPYKSEYTKEIQQDRLNIVKRNNLRQQLRASIKKLMEVEK